MLEANEKKHGYNLNGRYAFFENSGKILKNI